MVLAITTVVGELDGFYALLIGLLVATMTTLVLENAVISGFYALLIGLLVATWGQGVWAAVFGIVSMPS